MEQFEKYLHTYLSDAKKRIDGNTPTELDNLMMDVITSAINTKIRVSNTLNENTGNDQGEMLVVRSEAFPDIVIDIQLETDCTGSCTATCYVEGCNGPHYERQRFTEIDEEGN